MYNQLQEQQKTTRALQELLNDALKNRTPSQHSTQNTTHPASPCSKREKVLREMREIEATMSQLMQSIREIEEMDSPNGKLDAVKNTIRRYTELIQINQMRNYLSQFCGQYLIL